MNENKFICILFLFAAMTFFRPGFAFAITPSGASIGSQAEMKYDAGIITSETLLTTVKQMYGSAIEPSARQGAEVPGKTHYFSHSITNLGNGTDNFSFYFKVATPESWTFSLIDDDNENGFHETGEETPLLNPLPISEEGKIFFFIAVKMPSSETSGSTGEATVLSTGEVFDGNYYIGANGTIYGGPDTIEVTDALTAEALANLMIHSDGSTGDIYITWDGGNADIYCITGTFDASFAGSTVEAYNAPSPFYCSIEAKDGNIRFYRAALAGTSSFSDRTVGKFDIETATGFTFTSVPFVFPSLSYTYLNVVIGDQLTGGMLPIESDKIYSYQDNTWKQAYNKTGEGWTGTLQYFGSDTGAWIRILEGHPSGKLTYVGIISDAVSREITLSQGFNMVGTAYPVEVDLGSSNLDSILTSGEIPRFADRIYTYENSLWKQAYLKTGAGWVGTLLKLSPGRAYWIKKQGASAVWFYPKPY